MAYVEMIQCDECGALDDYHYHDFIHHEGSGEDLCQSCVEERLTSCDYCGEWVELDDVVSCHDQLICNYCTDDHHNDLLVEAEFVHDELGYCESCGSWEDGDFIFVEIAPMTEQPIKVPAPIAAEVPEKGWDRYLP